MITTVTASRRPLFSHFRAARCLIQVIMSPRGEARTLAFVVMPDHLHWLLRLGEQDDLSSHVRFVKSESARRINIVRSRQEKIWQRGFHDHALRKEESLRDCARYLIANPVRAGLVSSVRDYPHWDSIWVAGEYAGTD